MRQLRFARLWRTLDAILLLVIGGGTELLQVWLPGREGDPLDLVANVVGVLLGSTVSP